MKDSQLAGLKRNTALLTIFYALSTILHIAKEVLLAKIFGAGSTRAALVVVFQTPNMLARFFGGGLSSALIPRAANWLDEEGKPLPGFWRFYKKTALPLLILSLVIAAVFLIFAKPIVSVLGSGFDEEGKLLAESLFRILAFSLPLTLLTGICQACSHTLKRFMLPGLAGIVAPLIMIVWIIIDHERSGIHAAVWGFVVGQAVITAMLLLSILKLANADTDNHEKENTESSKETFLAIGLVFLGWVGGILNLQIDVSMATLLSPEKSASLQYAYTIMRLPTGLFFSSVGVALLPSLSAAIQSANLQSLQRSLSYAMRVAALILMPAAVLLFFGGKEIVATVYQRDAFTAHHSTLTAQALRGYAPAIFFYGILTIQINYFHARRKQGMIACIVLASSAINPALNWVLMQNYSHMGIAMSTSIVTGLEVILLQFLSSDLRWLASQRKIHASLLRAALACSALTAAILLIRPYIQNYPMVMQALLLAGSGALSFLLILTLLRGGEIQEILALFHKKKSTNTPS